MNKLLTKILAATLVMSCAGWAMAGEHGWATSVMKAYPTYQVYRVNFQRLDGKQPIDAHEYRLDAGEHTVRVSLVMETQWAPKLSRITNNEIYSKELTFTVEDGTTYFIGGKVDPDASDEAQRDGSFWDPIVYREKKK
jgi:hypothetical protein